MIFVSKGNLTISKHTSIIKAKDIVPTRIYHTWFTTTVTWEQTLFQQSWVFDILTQNCQHISHLSIWILKIVSGTLICLYTGLHYSAQLKYYTLHSKQHSGQTATYAWNPRTQEVEPDFDWLYSPSYTVRICLEQTNRNLHLTLWHSGKTFQQYHFFSYHLIS